MDKWINLALQGFGEWCFPTGFIGKKVIGKLIQEVLGGQEAPVMGFEQAP
jgi:hypothetical protein